MRNRNHKQIWRRITLERKIRDLLLKALSRIYTSTNSSETIIYGSKHRVSVLIPGDLFKTIQNIYHIV